MQFVKLEPICTVDRLATACKNAEDALGQCPCAGFHCPFLDLMCGEVTEEDWAGLIHDDEPAGITPEEAEEQRECCS